MQKSTSRSWAVLYRCFRRILSVAICVFILIGGAGVSFAADNNDIKKSNAKSSSEKAIDVNKIAGDVNGPTVVLDYNGEGIRKNPVASFMYFVPLISPVLVDRETSKGNQQYGGIISYDKEVDGNTFHLACDFLMAGKGYHNNTFDHNGMIERNVAVLKKGESLKNILDYIKFEGEGVGQVEVQGTIDGSKETVTRVDIHFNARGNRSTVTVRLYSIDPQDGKYKYENRYNIIVARVNTLTFKRGEGKPRMAIKVASISADEESNGWWSNVKGAIANLFIKPLEIEPIGNDAMLNFGYALLKKQPTFTFPKARNIKETRTAEQKKS